VIAAFLALALRRIHAAPRRHLSIETMDPRFNLKLPTGEMFDFFNVGVSTGYPRT
jgi:hypothetical protein